MLCIVAVLYYFRGDRKKMHADIQSGCLLFFFLCILLSLLPLNLWMQKTNRVSVQVVSLLYLYAFLW